MLEVHNLECRLSPDWTLRCSFSLPANQWLSVIGPSGSGKSTLVQCLAGFTPLSGGEIKIDGSDVQNLAPADRGFAIVFQNDTLFHHLTVRQNLVLALHDSPLTKRERSDRARHMLDRVKLPGSTFEKLPHQLSGGQRARVSVARALLRGSRWLILDESFAALDEKLRLELNFWLEDLKLRDGLSIIAVTHNQNEARLFSDSILALADGKMVFFGHPSELDAGLAAAGAHVHFASDHALIDNGSRILSVPPDQVTVLSGHADQITTSESGRAMLRLTNARVVRLSGGGWAVRDPGRSTLVPLATQPPEPPLMLTFPNGSGQGTGKPK
jgi:ABC-type sugar transport system ATPase subunit